MTSRQAYLKQEKGKQVGAMHTVYILVNRIQPVHSTALVLFKNCQKIIAGNAQE